LFLKGRVAIDKSLHEHIEKLQESIYYNANAILLMTFLPVLFFFSICTFFCLQFNSRNHSVIIHGQCA